MTSRATAEYRLSLASRPVAPPVDRRRLRSAFGGPLPTAGSPPAAVIDQLIRAADPGLVATAGPRFFGFVVGGSLPSAMAADLLAVGWDQLAFNAVSSPAAAVAEEVAGGWLKDLLGIPSVGVRRLRHRRTGGEHRRPGHRPAPCACRRRLGRRAGRAARAHQRVRVVASAERHATIDRSLRLLGFGNRSRRAGQHRPQRGHRCRRSPPGAGGRSERPDPGLPAVRQCQHRGLRQPAGSNRYRP